MMPVSPRHKGLDSDAEQIGIEAMRETRVASPAEIM